MNFSKEERAMWLEDWRRSGKSARAYAQKNGINPNTFSGWIKSEAKRTSGFVEIPEHKKPKLELSKEILVEKGDIKIRIPLSVWIEYPGAILEGLKAAP